MIERSAKETLLRLSQQFPVVAVTGPRQSGKSTLVKETFPDKRYVSFDDKTIRELAASNPRDFIRAFKDGVIIDEAQKVPELFDAIKLIVDSDEYAPGKYILTGSSQFKLKKNIRETLSGRIGIVNLLPLSIMELCRAGILGSDAYDYAFNGFYTPFYDDTKHFDREDWFENYIDTYLEKDVAEVIKVSNLSQFKKFVQFCAIYSGQMLNMESISREIGVTANTIKSWLSILENSFIIHLLEPDTNNLGRSIVKTPKLYFVDVGRDDVIRNAERLEPEFRRLVENFALVRDARRENPVEGADAVGADEQDFISEIIDVANLAAFWSRSGNRGL